MWNAFDGLLMIWKSNRIIWNFFQVVAVFILLYGCTTWTLTKHIEKKLDGNYTRMLSPISHTIQVRQMRCSWWNKNKLINDVLLWTPIHGHTSFGQPAKTYIHQLCVDTGYNLEHLPGVMGDGNRWWESQETLCHLCDLMMNKIWMTY